MHLQPRLTSATGSDRKFTCHTVCRLRLQIGQRIQLLAYRAEDDIRKLGNLGGSWWWRGMGASILDILCALEALAPMDKTSVRVQFDGCLRNLSVRICRSEELPAVGS